MLPCKSGYLMGKACSFSLFLFPPPPPQGLSVAQASLKHMILQCQNSRRAAPWPKSLILQSRSLDPSVCHQYNSNAYYFSLPTSYPGSSNRLFCLTQEKDAWNITPIRAEIFILGLLFILLRLNISLRKEHILPLLKAFQRIPGLLRPGGSM